MFISVSFPLADFRSLCRDNAGRLDRPHWGSADPRAQFARGFGAIHTRTKSGNGFVGENYYADCNSLLRFPTQLFLKPFGSDVRILAYPIYRRFYFDGIVSGRFEFGFRLNEPSIDAFAVLNGAAEYDVVAISKQTLTQEVKICLLDGRIEKSLFSDATALLRDGYIMSSTKQNSLSTFDLASIGSTYVSVGAPFVFIRSSPLTKASRLKQKRDLIKSQGLTLIQTRSGVHGQNFDTIVLPSERDLEDESSLERMARLFYSQIRSVTFAHSFYLKQVDAEDFKKSSSLAATIAALIERLKGLTPLENDTHDASVCLQLRQLLENTDINVSALTKEIESKFKQGRLGKIIARLLGYIDRKADIAIEAAASAATKSALGGGS